MRLILCDLMDCRLLGSSVHGILQAAQNTGLSYCAKLQKQIETFYAEAGIGEGKPKFKDYTNKDGETTKQFTLKLSEYTDIEGKDGLGEKDLRFGAKINILVRTYEWDNKFGKGTSARVQSIFVVEGGVKTNMDKIAE